MTNEPNTSLIHDVRAHLSRTVACRDRYECTCNRCKFDELVGRLGAAEAELLSRDAKATRTPGPMQPAGQWVEGIPTAEQLPDDENTYVMLSEGEKRGPWLWNGSEARNDGAKCRVTHWWNGDTHKAPPPPEDRDQQLEEREVAIEQEQARWQDAICKIVSEVDPSIDGAGCDSGDPLDVTTAEIHQAINKLQDELTEAKAERDRYKKLGQTTPANRVLREQRDEARQKLADATAEIKKLTEELLEAEQQRDRKVNSIDALEITVSELAEELDEAQQKLAEMTERQENTVVCTVCNQRVAAVPGDHQSAVDCCDGAHILKSTSRQQLAKAEAEQERLKLLLDGYRQKVEHYDRLDRLRDSDRQKLADAEAERDAARPPKVQPVTGHLDSIGPGSDLVHEQVRPPKVEPFTPEPGETAARQLPAGDWVISIDGRVRGRYRNPAILAMHLLMTIEQLDQWQAAQRAGFAAGAMPAIVTWPPATKEPEAK